LADNEDRVINNRFWAPWVPPSYGCPVH